MKGMVLPSANSFATAAICPAEIFSSAERRGSTFATFVSVVISSYLPFAVYSSRPQAERIV